MKRLYLTILVICIAVIVNAQDSKSLKIHPLNKVALKNRFHSPYFLNNQEFNNDTSFFRFKKGISIPIIKPPVKEIDPEPNLPFQEDNYYHMKIVYYINCYNAEEQIFEYNKSPLISRNQNFPMRITCY